jgi:hypothetical protein
VRYLEYFLREQEGTPPAIAAEAVQADLGAVMFWLGLDHDDQVLADSNHRGYEMFEIQDVTVLGTHND